MVVTRSGVAGVHVASHVMEEHNIVVVHAPIPRQQTVDKTAGDFLDEEKNREDVTRISAQVQVSSSFFFSNSEACGRCH